MPDPEESLFAAFCAGFDHSGEGYNGEFLAVPAADAAEQERLLREAFEKWLAARDAPTATSAAEDVIALWRRNMAALADSLRSYP